MAWPTGLKPVASPNSATSAMVAGVGSAPTPLAYETTQSCLYQPGGSQTSLHISQHSLK